MAGTTTTSTVTTHAESDLRDVIVEHNKLVDDVAALAARLVSLGTKLDADAGVSDTNYGTTLNAAAVNFTAAKVGDRSGTAIT